MLKAKARLEEEKRAEEAHRFSLQQQQHAASEASSSSASSSAEVNNSSSITLELEHAVGFSGNIPGSMAMHPNGVNFITVSGGCVVINDMNDPHNQVFLRGHDDDISCLEVSPSGRLIASGQFGENSDAIVWDFEQHALLWRLSEHFHGIACVSFSNDERFLCTIGDSTDKKMLVWDLHTGNLVCSQPINPEPSRCVCWGGRVKDVKRRDTSDYLLATGGANSIRLWSMTPSTGALTSVPCVINHLERTYTCLKFSRDGERLFAGTESGDFIVATMRNRSLFCNVRACAIGVLSLSLGSQGDIIVGGGDGSVVCFAEHDKTYIETARTQLLGGVTSLSPSSDNLEIGAGTAEGCVYRIRASNFDSVLVSENHSRGVTGVAFARGNSNLFATCANDGTIRLWDSGDYTVQARSFVRGAQPLCVALTDEVSVSGWSDGKIRAFDASTGEALWSITDAHLNGVTALAFSPNYKFIVSGGVNGEIRVWEVKSRELVAHLKEHNARVNAVAIFDDNLHVLSCSRDRSFLCWDLQQEKRVSSHIQRMGGINAMKLSKDQQTVLTAGQEKKITFWDLRKANPEQIISPAHDGEATCMAVSNDGTLFVTGGTDQRVKLWDFATGTCLADGVGHSNVVTAVEFAPDDRQIISTGLDGGIFVWNLFR